MTRGFSPVKSRTSFVPSSLTSHFSLVPAGISTTTLIVPS